VNEVKKVAGRLNDRLPAHLQLKNATGHTGRRTFASVAMNSEGGDALATAIATGHRDPKSLMTYVTPSSGLKMKAARDVGKATSSSSSVKRKLSEIVAEDEEEEDVEE